jgi:hypothetical protein
MDPKVIRFQIFIWSLALMFTGMFALFLIFRSKS